MMAVRENVWTACRMKKRRFGNTTLMLSALLVLIVLPVHAQKVNVGYDRNADFSKFKTYAWTSGVPAKNPQIDQQIIAIIDRQLVQKGLRRVSENQDLNISYHAAVFDDFDQATVGKPDWVPGAGNLNQAWQVKRGSLIVVLKETKRNEEVWRASAVETVNEDWNVDLSKNVDKATKKIKKAVDKIFKVFPPK